MRRVMELYMSENLNTDPDTIAEDQETWEHMSDEDQKRLVQVALDTLKAQGVSEETVVQVAHEMVGCSGDTVEEGDRNAVGIMVQLCRSPRVRSMLFGLALATLFIAYDIKPPWKFQLWLHSFTGWGSEPSNAVESSLVRATPNLLYAY